MAIMSEPETEVPKKSRKTNDRRSETSRANIRKAQATKAQNQREIKEKVADFAQKLAKKTKQRGPIVNDPLPIVVPLPKQASRASPRPQVELPEESSEDDEEEIVIRSRPKRTPVSRSSRRHTQVQELPINHELERYMAEVAILKQQLEYATRKPPRKPRQPPQPKPKPEPQVIHIVTPAPTPTKPSVAEEAIKKRMLCQF